MALGKGLGAILQEVGDAYASEMASSDELISTDMEGLVADINIDIIDPNPYQPRKYFDNEKLQELAESIKNYGLLQPVVVIKNSDRYILVAGERRLRAHKLIDEEYIKAIVADVDFDEIRMRELALIENIQRENLNPVELAQSYQELITVHEITHDELSQIVHKSRSQITNTLRLLALNTYAKDALVSEKITQGHAKILVGMDDGAQRIMVDTIIGQKLSVRETEGLVKSSKRKETTKEITKNIFKIDTLSKREISENLNFKHKIKQSSVEIVLQNEDELIEFIRYIKNR